VAPTIVNHTDFEQSGILAVSDTGELIAADEDAVETDEPHVNGHSFEEPTTAESSETSNVAEGGDPDESASETLEDEIVEEDFISDEIFAAEDELEEETQIKEELSAGEDFPGEDQASDGEQKPATDEEKED
jgi:segregation and condensation protein B